MQNLISATVLAYTNEIDHVVVTVGYGETTYDIYYSNTHPSYPLAKYAAKYCLEGCIDGVINNGTFVPLDTSYN